MFKRRFTDKDFDNNKEFISVGDLKPMIVDIIKQHLTEEIEELIKQHIQKYIIKNDNNDDDFEWDYNSYTVLTNKSVSNNPNN